MNKSYLPVPLVEASLLLNISVEAVERFITTGESIGGNGRLELVTSKQNKLCVSGESLRIVMGNMRLKHLRSATDVCTNNEANASLINNKRHGKRIRDVNTNSIISAVCNEFKLSRKNVELKMIGGCYHWAGAIGDLFFTGHTGQECINSLSLAVWVDDFRFRLNEWRKETGLNDIELAANEIKVKEFN